MDALPPLIAFTVTLLDHAANDSRTSVHAIERSVQKITEHYETLKTMEVFWNERYMNTHEYPRIAFEQSYIADTSIRNEKYHEWQKTKTKQALMAYLSLCAPPSIDKRRHISEEIYTRCV